MSWFFVGGNMLVGMFCEDRESIPIKIVGNTKALVLTDFGADISKFSAVCVYRDECSC